MTLDDFISRWTDREGGQERANYALFLSELCDVLEVPRPHPADANAETNDYVFERAVKETAREGSTSAKRIDLYKRDAFILEAKQSRQKGGAKELEGQGVLFEPAPGTRGKRTASKAWDILMMNARQQAENYVRLLPTNHTAPPFVIVCDVGHCFEVYANFRRDGKAYDQFPDRQGFRIYLEDLRDAKIRERLRGIWLNPEALDPSRNAARVTREIAERLAKVSKSLEAKHKPERVAMFLMRCLFTMFAEDVGLLPEKSFKAVLEGCEKEPDTFVPVVHQLWEAMDKGGFAHAIRKTVKRFNGEFFKNPEVLPLSAEAIFELRHAAGYDWKEVEPAIFGTLVEQALDPSERKALGAHYTPRAYVERLVHATIMDPLRSDWANVLSTVEKLKAANKPNEAIKAVQSFHTMLTELRVLDPACGTGNFLYVSLELLKRLEGEVLEVLADLGGQEVLTGFGIDPHQFLGLELNPRAAAIAELVLWIGYLQWFYRTSKGEPPEPILKAFHNIKEKDAVLTPDWKRRPEWPDAEFIVGNPPFIGAKDIRTRMPEGYPEALWAVHKHMNESADFVMYWWDRAAEILARKGTKLRRFGLVTTNSISQVFQRRVMEAHFQAKRPISLVMAIADHPWTKAAKDSAAVRIAMTVCAAGKHEGTLYEVTREQGLDSDAPQLTLSETRGIIHSDLTNGVDVTKAQVLKANEGLCANGMKPIGEGFWVTKGEAIRLGLGTRKNAEKHLRQYRNGRDLAAYSRDVYVIDLLGLEIDEVRQQFPEIYQHILASVYEYRQTNNRASYREKWWIFGEPRKELRPAIEGLPRFIVTIQTAKHRVFQFLDAEFMPDQKLMVLGSDDPFLLGVLSSKIHTKWTLKTCSWLGVGNDAVYVKARSFDPFPFPEASEAQKSAIRTLAEELDALRKRVLAAHPHLTLTGLYNVLERVKAGIVPDALTPDERRTFNDGLILVLKELHEKLDVAVADAYGWPADASDDAILANLVALNAQRAKEEARGKVKWLRPEYQIPRFGSVKEKAELDLIGGASGTAEATGPKPAFPDEDVAQTAAIMAVLAMAPAPLTASDLALAFRQGRKVERKVVEVVEAIARMGYASREPQGYAMRRAA